MPEQDRNRQVHRHPTETKKVVDVQCPCCQKAILLMGKVKPWWKRRSQMPQALTHYQTARQLLATSTDNPQLQHGLQALLTVLDEKTANLDASR